MNQRQTDQLDKILALADSSHDGEAVGAVRMARQMLSRDGLSFGDLARAANHRSRFSFSRSLFAGSAPAHRLESRVMELQQRLGDMAREYQTQATQLEFWQRRALEAEQQLNLSLTDAQRWKQIARDTAEKLWDIGQLTAPNEFVAEKPVVRPPLLKVVGE